jgi:hypothetical protein
MRVRARGFAVEEGKSKGRSRASDARPSTPAKDEHASVVGGEEERELSRRHASASQTASNDDITAQERRRAFEDLREAAAYPQVDLDARLLDVLARDVAEPRGEVFPGEIDALVATLVVGQDGQSFPARVLAQAAMEIAEDSSRGTRAGRAALLRAVASFLLHDRVLLMAARSNNCRQSR